MRIVAVLLICGLAAGCAYPRRSTSLSPVGANTSTETATAPEFAWQMRLVGAQVPPRKRSGDAWDDDGTPPDPLARIYRDDDLVFEGPIGTNTLSPQWGVTVPENVLLPPNARLRFELWDSDGGSDDLIGIWRNRGMPSDVLPDADASIRLDGGAMLSIRLSSPRPHRGVGIREYEVHSSRFVVTDVLPHSPAGRAGIVPGDSIVAIGDQTVEDLGEARAASALSLAAEEQTDLTVRGPDGAHRSVQLDRGVVWVTR